MFKNRWGSVGLIAIALMMIALPAIQPLLRGQLPLSADGVLHLYRLVSLDHTLSDGTLWARYAAGMAYGYGAPFFNFYSPSSLYLMLGFHTVGASFVQAWLWGMIVYTLIAAIGAYLLGSAWFYPISPKFAPIVGLITAAGYLYAPYTLYDLIWRGTVSEMASLALFPWVLWALYRLTEHGRRSDWIIAIALYAAFIPMHNVITLHGSALIGIYALFLLTRKKWALGVLLQLGSALVLPLLITAFFTLPALTETRYVKLDAITADLPEIDVTRNLTPLSALLTWPTTADPQRLQPPIPIALSWAQLLIAILALGVRRLRGLVLISIGLIALLIWMNTPSSAIVWETIPLIRYSQFPWRLVGLASLLLALLAGIGVGTLLIRIPRLAAPIAILSLIAILIYAFPLLYPIYVDDINPISIRDAQRFERESGFVVTSSFGEYLPIWNFEPVDPNALTTVFEESLTINRLVTPSSITVINESWGQTWGDLTLTALEATDLTFNWFYFPGWQATLNDQTLDLRPSERFGLIQATIPAGTHHLTIALQNTDRQNLAWLISAIGVISTIIGLLRPHGKRIMTDHHATPVQLITVIVIAMIALFLVKVLIIDRIDSPIRADRFAHGNPLPYPLEANFDNLITLRGYDRSQATLTSDGELQLDLFWQAQQPLFTDYSTVITLRDPQGDPIATAIDWQPAGLTTRHWLPGYYLQQPIRLKLPRGSAPGDYTIDLALYDPIGQTSLQVIDSAGNPIDVRLHLGSTWTVIRPDQPDQAPFEGQALGADLAVKWQSNLPSSAEVGDPVTINWLWKITDRLDPTLPIRLIWQQAEQIVAEIPITPVTHYPITEWGVGDVWGDLKQVYVPAMLPQGDYEVALQRGAAVIPWGIMTITTPERLFNPPILPYTSDVRWENGMRLLGYTIEPTITLYWTTDQSIPADLHLFVQVLNEQGQLVRQFAGSIPRRTTSWITDEVIQVDSGIAFPTEAGYQVIVGWYDQMSGTRVTIGNEVDFMVIER